MIFYANPETTKQRQMNPYETIWCDVVENNGMYAGHEPPGFWIEKMATFDFMSIPYGLWIAFIWIGNKIRILHAKVFRSQDCLRCGPQNFWSIDMPWFSKVW